MENDLEAARAAVRGLLRRMRGTQTECCAVVVRHTAFRLFPPYPPPAPFTSPSPPCAAVPVPHRLCVVGSSLGWAHQRERSPQIAPALVPGAGGGGAGMAASGSDKVFSGGARPPCPSRPALPFPPRAAPAAAPAAKGPGRPTGGDPPCLHGGRQGRAGGGGVRAAHGPEAGPGQPPVRRTAALNPVGDFLSCLGARRGGDRAGAPGAPAGRGTRLRTGARPCTGGGRGYLGVLGLRFLQLQAPHLLRDGGGRRAPRGCCGSLNGDRDRPEVALPRRRARRPPSLHRGSLRGSGPPPCDARSRGPRGGGAERARLAAARRGLTRPPAARSDHGGLPVEIRPRGGNRHRRWVQCPFRTGGGGAGRRRSLGPRPLPAPRQTGGRR